MPNLWMDEAGEQYVKVTSDKLLEYLEERRMFGEGDDEWATILDIQKQLEINQHTVVGIIMYNWLHDKIKVKPNDDGDLIVCIVW